MSWGWAWAAAGAALIGFRLVIWGATAWLSARPASPARAAPGALAAPGASANPAAQAAVAALAAIADPAAAVVPVAPVTTSSIWSAGAPFAFFQGHDGRWSTSKTSALLWTYAVVWAFLAILFRTGGGHNFPKDQLQPEYLIVMGIPLGSALLAKAITTANVTSGKVTSKSAAGPATFDPAKGLAQLIGNDQGDLDLADFQYFLFNCVLLGFFFVTFFRLKMPVLPNLPDSLFALSGVSAAAYVAKKTQEGGADPAILTIVPPGAEPRQKVTLNGTTLADESGTTVQVIFGNLAATGQVVMSAGSESVTVSVPDNAPRGAMNVYIVNSRGKATTPQTFTVL
jgi:hypothetical protein